MHAIRVMVIPARCLDSLLPLCRGERAPERSDGQTHGWRAGLFCRRREERLPSTFAALSVDAMPYWTAIGVHAAVSARLPGKGRRDGSPVFHAARAAQLRSGVTFNIAPYTGLHFKPCSNITFTYNSNTRCYVNGHYNIEGIFIDVSATCAEGGS